MDNLPNDPSNPNIGNNNNPPSPFGSGFNPHSNPLDPNNPYASQPQSNPVPPPPQTPPLNIPNPPNIPNIPENPDVVKHEHYSEAAQNKPRDEHGHFKSNSSQAPLIHTNPDLQTPIQSGQTPPTSQTAPNTPNSSFLPPIIEINQNTKPTEKEVSIRQ